MFYLFHRSCYLYTKKLTELASLISLIKVLIILMKILSWFSVTSFEAISTEIYESLIDPAIATTVENLRWQGNVLSWPHLNRELESPDQTIKQIVSMNIMLRLNGKVWK